MIKSKTSETIDKTFTRIIFAVFLILGSSLVFFVQFPKFIPPTVQQSIDHALTVAGWTKREFAVVIDAGSTGSRVLGFSFHRNLLTGQLRLDDELWREEKPGLSSYKEKPAAAAESIIKLLDQAKTRIPREEWKHTPITLKATAGLRLLPKEKSEAIINEVRSVLMASGFKPEEPLIEIMNPMEEGLMAWFTVNFLLDELEQSVTESHVTFDLGGGSTQITFAPQNSVHGIDGRKHFLHNVTVFHEQTVVYSHSYLGLGLMAVREAVFSNGNAEQGTKKVVTSPCMTSTEPVEWTFHGIDFVINGDEKSSYTECLSLVKMLLEKENVHSPTEIKDREVAAFSYFYDRALDMNIIPRNVNQATALVGDYVAAAKKACQLLKPSFLCIDLTYISSLLTDGYGLPHDKELYIFKKINGHEVSWALGVAYSILEKDN